MPRTKKTKTTTMDDNLPINNDDIPNVHTPLNPKSPVATSSDPNAPKPPELQQISLENKESSPPPPPYDFSERWYSKHKDAPEDCCIECLWRVSCVPCLCATCVVSSIFTAPCYCCYAPYEVQVYEDGALKYTRDVGSYQNNVEQNVRGKVVSKVCVKRPTYSQSKDVQCCWAPFIFLDNCIVTSSMCCMGWIKASDRTPGEVKGMNECSTWWGDCCSKCYDCVHCIACCPFNICSACWNSKCVQSCVRCVQNAGYYTGRCICGCKNFAYYCVEGICIRCGCGCCCSNKVPLPPPPRQEMEA